MLINQNNENTDMGNPNLFSLIRTKYNTLSESQKGAANYIMEHPEKVMYSSLGSLANTLKVSETTILRFLRKIGYSSYQVFKVHLAQEISGDKNINIFDEISKDDTCEDVINKIVQFTAKSIQDSRQSIDIKEFDKIISRILDCSRLFITGVGSSGAVAFDLYHKLLKLDLNCSYSSDTHIMNIICSNLKEDDMLICISHSGESNEILNAVSRAKACGCKICSITSFENSTLANQSDFKLISSSIETHYRSDALTSRIIQMTFIDMIYISLAIRLDGFALKAIERSREAVASNKR